MIVTNVFYIMWMIWNSSMNMFCLLFNFKYHVLMFLFFIYTDLIAYECNNHVLRNGQSMGVLSLNDLAVDGTLNINKQISVCT